LRALGYFRIDQPSGGMPALLPALALAISLGAGLTFCCYCSSGIGLDFFIAPLFLTAFTCPTAAAIAGRLPGAGVIAIGLAMGSGLVWGIALHSNAIGWGQWAEALFLLFTFAGAIGSIVWLMIILKVAKIVAAAIGVAVSLAWLTCPIWLSIGLAGGSVGQMIQLHPLFVMNHIVYSPAIGLWPEQAGAYGLTSLGQDVQYELPGTMLPILVFHGAMMLLAGSIGWFCCRMASRSINQIETDANASISR